RPRAGLCRSRPAVHRAPGPVMDPARPLDVRDLRDPGHRRAPDRVGAETAWSRARVLRGVRAVHRPLAGTRAGPLHGGVVARDAALLGTAVADPRDVAR